MLSLSQAFLQGIKIDATSSECGGFTFFIRPIVKTGMPTYKAKEEL